LEVSALRRIVDGGLYSVGDQVHDWLAEETEGVEA
jgi:hypothetical protein